jgi:plasmid maintenance system killer protein
MIRSCGDKETEKLRQRRFSKKFAGIEKSARIRLELLDAATSLNDLQLPRLRLEPLIEGDNTAYGSMTRTESVLSGSMGMPITSKLWTTIRRNQYAR